MDSAGERRCAERKWESLRRLIQTAMHVVKQTLASRTFALCPCVPAQGGFHAPNDRLELVEMLTQ